jgi:hypothetical protein
MTRASRMTRILIAVLLLVSLAAIAAAHPASATPSRQDASLDVPPIAQLLTPADGADDGKHNCTAAAVAMLLEALHVKIPDEFGGDYYKFARHQLRKSVPNPNQNIGLDRARDSLPALTGGALVGTLDLWGEPVDKANQADRDAFSSHWEDFLSGQLRQGYPVIAAIMDWRKLPAEKNYRDREVHAIVVTGLRGGEVIFNDPWSGQQHSMSASDFAAAWSEPQPGAPYSWIALTVQSTGSLPPGNSAQTPSRTPSVTPTPSRAPTASPTVPPTQSPSPTPTPTPDLGWTTFRSDQMLYSVDYPAAIFSSPQSVPPDFDSFSFAVEGTVGSGFGVTKYRSQIQIDFEAYVADQLRGWQAAPEANVVLVSEGKLPIPPDGYFPTARLEGTVPGPNGNLRMKEYLVYARPDGIIWDLSFFGGDSSLDAYVDRMFDSFIPFSSTY